MTLHTTRTKLLGSTVGLILWVACEDSSSTGARDAGEHGHEHDGEGNHEHGGADAGSGELGAQRVEAVSGNGGSRGAAGKSARSVAGEGGAGGQSSAGVAGGKGESGGDASGADSAGSGGSGGAGTGADVAGAGGAGGSDSADTDAVTIRFKAVVGAQEFACGTSYENQGSNASTVTPQDMRLFIQDLALITEQGTRVPITFDVRAPWQSETVALLDFEDNSGNCAEGTSAINREITGRVASGTYAGLSFVNGVPQNLNHADPTMLPEPLKTSANLSWSWLSGFRFSKIELVNTEPGEADFGRALFHPGATGCTGNPNQGTVTCVRSNRAEVVLEDFDRETDTVIIDVAELFKNVDLETANECHATPQEICDPMYNAWGIDFANGATKAGQTAFKKQ